jgi:hypothetical protein
MVIKMESHPIEEPEAIIPMETVSSGGQSAIEEPEAIIPMEIVSSGGQSDTPTPTITTGRLRRKVARRTESWYPQPPPPPRRVTREGQLPTYFVSRPPQDEDNPERKKPRLEEPLPTTIDVAARKTASPDLSVNLSPPHAADDDDDANVEPVTDTQPNAGANSATAHWKTDEDAELTSAVANTSKKKWGSKRITDWDAVAALVLGRTGKQCRNRWLDSVYPRIDQANGGSGRWTAVEDIELKDSVQTHGGKNWVAISALVPGRTKLQCRSRWKYALDPSIGRASGRTGQWADVEDSKLKNAVQTHGCNNWVAISALVPGRTKKQCCHRWHDVLDPSIDRANERSGTWTSVEDIKLKDSVQTHGDKDWVAISALVPGRTKIQCRQRWQDALNPSIGRAGGRTGRWTGDEDGKLKDAIQTHGSKNWIAISALVPGRTKLQCRSRWKDVLDPSIGRASGRTGQWVDDEDSKLKNAVQTHGCKNWETIAALVSSRTKLQCRNRWHHALNPSIALTAGREGGWAENEDKKLKDAVLTHGGKNWAAIATLVPDRTKLQCYHRWHDGTNPSIALEAGRVGKWAEDEVTKLKDAVLTHTDKNWKEIATLVLGRTKKQCREKWSAMESNRSTVLEKAECTLKNAPARGQGSHSP